MCTPPREVAALRAFAVLLIALAAIPWPGSAQAAERLYRIGFLGQTTPADLGRQLAALQDGLRAQGYAEGRNLQMEYRWAERKLKRLPALAAQAFERLAQQGVHALVVPNTSLLNPLAAQIASLAMTHRLPSIGSTVFAQAGGLLAYGPDGADMYRRAAHYVDAVLKGARAGELPMEGPPRFELTLNLKTARRLSFTFPPALVSQVDRRIE